MRRRPLRGRRWILLSLVAALTLTVIPLPWPLDLLRPDFVALTILWLCLLSVRATGLALAFLAGLALDVLHGQLLGQNALALVLIAYIALKMRLRIRAFTGPQQAAVVCALLALDQFVLFWTDGLSGHAVTAWTRWLPVFTGAALWPLLSGLFQRLGFRA